MRIKYNKIRKQDVVNIIINTAHSWNSCGIISPSNITSLLETSRYQVNKYIKELKTDGLLDYKIIDLSDPEDDWFPPYQGYLLSKKGQEVYHKELKKYDDYQNKLIKECFGC